MERIKSVSFEAVVEVDEGGLLGRRFGEGHDEFSPGGPRFFVDLHCFIVGREGIDGFVVVATGGEEKAGGGEVGGA